MQKDPARLPPLDLLLAFEAAARQLSFTKAAQERFVTQSAVSRQVKALEDDLGVALFRRRHRALDLTEEGHRLAASVRDVLAGLRQTVARIRAPQRREVLSLTTTPGLASLWLIPRLSELVKVQPGIDVRIDATLQKRDLTAEGFDVAIRYLGVKSAAGTPLFAETIQLVCAPALARDPSRPIRKLQDLRYHTLLQVDAPRAGYPLEWDLWMRAVGIAGLEPASEIMFTNYDAAIAAAVAGQGMALGRRPLIDSLLERGALVAPLGDEIASMRGYYLVLEATAAKRPSVRALADWLVEQARLTASGETSATPRAKLSAAKASAARASAVKATLVTPVQAPSRGAASSRRRRAKP